MSGDGYDRRPRWKRAVRRSPRLHSQTKHVLLVLHDHMQADGKVSVSRATIAGELGWRYVTRVSAHIKAAHEAGFLTTVVKGAFGRTATWQALLPDEPATVRKTKTVRGELPADGYDPSNRPLGADTITKADPGPEPQTDMALTGKPQAQQSCLCSRRLGVNPRAA